MPAKKVKADNEASKDITKDISEDISKDISIEEGFDKLNELLNNMEAEDIGLEASFDLYKQGVELVKILNGKLDDVEGKLVDVNGE